MDTKFNGLGKEVEKDYCVFKNKSICTCATMEPLISYLTKEEVQKHLRISDTTYYDWRREGILKPFRTHGEDRYLPWQINKVVFGKGYRDRLRPKN
ncbi:MAG TPA: helix-turn-helix domain-containing protein [Flavobacteriaceae bacterium]|nr:helix-turn-helix domain-containing protein [Flavobacteriaceae bacterium]